MAAKIVVACGSGVATSEMVAVKIRGLLEGRGVKAQVVAVDVDHAEEALADADVFVPVVSAELDYGVPVVSGSAFLTGINVEKELDRLVDAVRSAQAEKGDGAAGPTKKGDGVEPAEG